jgi:hypothetical protein
MKTSACSSGTHVVIIIVRLHCSLRRFVDLVGALKHLHDLLHDLRLHALGLLELLAVAEYHSGGSLGDTEVRLVYHVSHNLKGRVRRGGLTLALACSAMSTL